MTETHHQDHHGMGGYLIYKYKHNITDQITGQDRQSETHIQDHHEKGFTK